MGDGDSGYNAYAEELKKKNQAQANIDWSKASTITNKAKAGWYQRHYNAQGHTVSYNPNWSTRGSRGGKDMFGNKIKSGAQNPKVNWNERDKSGRPVYETNATLIANRKKAFQEDFYRQAKSWKGNEWMKKSLDQAWDKDEFGIRSSYTRKFYGGVDNSGHEGGEVKTYGGYGLFDKKSMNKLAHSYAASAQERFKIAQETKEIEQMESRRRARGGFGSRGSTMLTGGREGVLSAATTRRKTLIGTGEREG